MTKTKTHPAFGNGSIPKTFDALSIAHPLRPIHDKVSHENALEIIRVLSGRNLNDDQEDYLEVLGTLVNEYEENNLETLPDAKPVEVLKFLMSDRNISTRGARTYPGKGRIIGIEDPHGRTINHP